RAEGNPISSEGLHRLWSRQSAARPRALLNSIGMRFVRIPDGTFLMGARDGEPGHFSHEFPRHRVTLTRPFWLGAFPVTQGHYRTVMGENPSFHDEEHGGGPNYPVCSVCWTDAEEFCRRLSAHDEELHAGRRYRLPTEAEWEFACRGGTETYYASG